MLAYLVSGFINIEKISASSENTQIPDGLKEAGYPFHGYMILIGTLIGMLPTVLDSLLVSNLFKSDLTFYRVKPESFTESVKIR